MSNTRTYKPQIATINGVSAAGITSVVYEEGYAQVATGAGDDQLVPSVDRHAQYCRGSFACEDWTKILDLLNADESTFTVYESESGAATYTKHTFAKPVIYDISLNIVNGRYASISGRFECRADAASDTIVDLHGVETGESLPSRVAATRGGSRIVSALLGSIEIPHATSFSLSLSFPILRSSADDDLAHMAVDRVEDQISVSGSIECESGYDTTALTRQLAIASAADDLVITVEMAGSTANKTITVKNALFLTTSGNSGSGYTAGPISFTINGTAEMTLTGATAFLEIAAVA
jgi:hypothetical protein